MKNILVTGGCGFVGTSIVRYLNKSSKYNIRILDNLSTSIDLDQSGLDFNQKSVEGLAETIDSLELVVGDIRSYDCVMKSLAGIDAVIHLAAQTGVIPSVEKPHEDMEINVAGTLNILEASRRNNVDKVIIASSSAPLGEQSHLPLNEECLPNPMAPYGASKLASEAYARVYNSSYGLKTVIFRFSNLYGPYSYHKGSVISQFIKAILNKEALHVFGNGQQTRDFIYVDDLCRAHEIALELDVGGEIFHLASGTSSSVNDVIQLLRDIVSESGYELPNVVYEPERSGEIRDSYSDITKAANVLGFEPEIDLSAGLRKSWEWFCHNQAQFTSPRQLEKAN